MSVRGMCISHLKMISQRKYVRLGDVQTDIASVWKLLTKHWKLKVPNMVLSITGGDVTDLTKKPRLHKNFREGLIKTAATTCKSLLAHSFPLSVTLNCNKNQKTNNDCLHYFFLDSRLDHYRRALCWIIQRNWWHISRGPWENWMGRRESWFAVNSFHSMGNFSRQKTSLWNLGKI